MLILIKAPENIWLARKLKYSFYSNKLNLKAIGKTSVFPLLISECSCSYNGFNLFFKLSNIFLCLNSLISTGYYYYILLHLKLQFCLLLPLLGYLMEEKHLFFRNVYYDFIYWYSYYYLLLKRRKQILSLKCYQKRNSILCYLHIWY